MARADEGRGRGTDDIRRPDLGQTRLLLAAGEPDAANEIATVLEAIGSQVYTSTPATTEELERLLDLLAPDVLVISPHPDGDVVALYRRIRTPPHRSLLPVVVLGADHEERMALLRAGAEAVLSPGLDEQELQATVTGIAERSSLVGHQKEVDELTGALTAQALHERLDYEIRRSRRYHRGGCLGLIELANLASVRDDLGDVAHDASLRRCAQVARQGLRDTDVLGHVSDDRFAVVMPDTDLPGSVRALRRIVEAGMATTLELPGDTTVAFAMHAAVGPFGPESFDALLERVSSALPGAEAREGHVATV